jgi:hypothetical protein
MKILKTLLSGVFSSLLLANMAAAAVSATCPNSSAEYELNSDPTIQAHFENDNFDGRSRVLIAISFTKTNRVYRFEIGQGNGFFSDAWLLPVDVKRMSPDGGEPFLVSRNVEVLPMNFYVVDSSNLIHSEIPRMDEAGFPMLFLTNLGASLYYLSHKFGLENERDVFPHGFLELKRCRQ